MQLVFYLFFIPITIIPFVIYRTLMCIRMIFLLPSLVIKKENNLYAKEWWLYTMTLTLDPLSENKEVNMRSVSAKHIKEINKQVEEHHEKDKWWVLYNYFDNEKTKLEFQNFRDNFHRIYTQSGLENVVIAIVKLPGQSALSLYFIGTTADVVEVKNEQALTEDFYNGYEVIDLNQKKDEDFDITQLTLDSCQFKFDFGQFQGYKTTRIPVTAIKAVRYLHIDEPLYRLADLLKNQDNNNDSPLIRQWRFESERYLTVKRYLEPLLEDVSIPQFIKDMMMDRIPYLETLDDDMATKMFAHEDYLFYFLRFSDDLFFMPYKDELKKIKEYNYVKGYLQDNSLYTQHEVIHKLKEDGHTEFINNFIGAYVS